MLDSEQIHNELIKLGYDIEPGKNHPSYAYEHYMGNGIYLYVKRRDGSSVQKEPLVFPPMAGKLEREVQNVKGLHLSPTPAKSTSYRKFPKLNGQSQHGYPADIEDTNAIAAVVEIFGRQEAAVSPFPGNTPKLSQESSMRFPLNQILYGPPGTGKTYQTTALAVQIADPEWYRENIDPSASAEGRAALKARFDELVREERIGFTTFHQSFAYEDFIEGIRAETDPETGELRYPVRDGVFKTLCKNADRKVIAHQTISPESLSARAVWKMSLGNSQTAEAGEVFTECLENNYVLLGWGGDADFSGCDDYESVKKRYLERYPAEKQEYAFRAVNTFRNQVKEGDLLVISDGNSRFRAVAEVTGHHRTLEDKPDWFHQARDVKWLQVYENSRPVSELYGSQFTQMTLYKLKPSKLNTSRLLEMVSTETPEEDAPPHVLIIDEINRGNIARIFGELITLLEPSKRAGAPDAQTVTLPYSKEQFSVPSNVFVIGTMNTADKSLAQLDLALRRRFSFMEMLPDPSHLSGVSVYDTPIDMLIDLMNQRIEVLLDSEHQIGHAYFMELANITSESERRIVLKHIFRDKVIPLLQEYFFEDYERIGWVLNDPVKASEHKFITPGTTSVSSRTRQLSDLFPGEIAEHLTDNRFRINEKAFDEPEAYQHIVGTVR
ncbi:ATPase [Marinobacter santoriniensis NKSG1]|uniref:ATPase n=1 Tax=Marinobacter santoriniensis NKSG1 TaxID=1288826 RepID=M7CTX7_9GAMM|nr:AAA family ATPase [Marinobacter santoriniensis]EMP57031.1 ATPase [Marinobacter santoriniensis NKSG1]